MTSRSATITDGTGAALLADTFDVAISPTDQTLSVQSTGDYATVFTLLPSRFRLTTYTFTTGGTFTLGFGVFNATDEIVDSGLFLDNVVLQSAPVIPEPGSLIVWSVAGLSGMVLGSRRRS